MSVITTQQLQVVNGNFNFPSVGGKYGVSNLTSLQTNPGGGAPGEITAIATGQGTLVDLTTLPVAVGGGWCMFQNIDTSITVTWGVDDGSGNIKKVGDMLPGEPAGPFRCSAAQTKYRFLAASGTPKVQVVFMVP